jgi:hypothetical protein
MKTLDQAVSEPFRKMLAAMVHRVAFPAPIASHSRSGRIVIPPHNTLSNPVSARAADLAAC